MSNQNTREYYAVRAATARDMAANASAEHIAKIHAEMAKRYDELAELAEPERQKLRIVAG